MGLSALDTVLWAATIVMLAVLVVTLVFKKRFRVAPWFTIWISSGLTLTLALYITYRLGRSSLYTILYWGWAVADLLLQLAVIVEIARSVLKRDGRWVEGSHTRFLAMAGVSVLLSVSLALSVHPATVYATDTWAVRGNLFTTLLICMLFSALMFVSQQFGLSWRSHIMRIGYGLTAWALTSFIVDMLHSYWGITRHYAQLDRIRNFAYLGSLIYWFVALWRAEVGKKLSPDVFSRLSSLHEQVEYELSDSSPTDEERFS